MGWCKIKSILVGVSVRFYLHYDAVSLQSVAVVDVATGGEECSYQTTD